MLKQVWKRDLTDQCLAKEKKIHLCLWIDILREYCFKTFDYGFAMLNAIPSRSCFSYLISMCDECVSAVKQKNKLEAKNSFNTM